MTDAITLISRFIRPSADIQPDHALIEIGVDEIDRAGIRHAIETEHGRDLSDEEIERWAHVSDIQRSIDRVSRIEPYNSTAAPTSKGDFSGSPALLPTRNSAVGSSRGAVSGGAEGRPGMPSNHGRGE